MPDVQESVKTIFGKALEIQSQDQRAKYLDQACAGDESLRAELDDLLGAIARAGNFLGGAPPADATIDLPPIAESPGTTIGRYKLLEEIAEGGMGVVYMAEQREPVRRKVALKIIKPGMDTREVIARFEAERQALAMMDHLNIAKVFDAGETASGRSYFVMELVRGISLTDYCDQNELTTRERLELFAQVCHAVQHAHQKGIIHRDLKPSNVMVTLYDGVPVPKIIDFGIAKATTGQLTERSVFTHYGQMIGTPLYMSPEQAEMSGLDVDTRSDVYSLGMMLYELLTGSTPFDQERVQKAGYDELRRMIREDEPPRPSARISTLGAAATTISTHRKTDPVKLSQLLQRDLDWIVMKALQKDRTRRYQTASDFARDVDRYLHDEPVEARPPTLADRVTKWVRRHRPLVTSAAVLLVFSTIALAISTLLIARERSRTEVAYKETEEAYKEKDQQLTATQKAEQLAREQEELAKQQEEAAKKQAALAREQRQLAIAQEKQAIQQRDAAQRNLYLASMRLAIQDWKAGQTARLLETLDSHLPQSGQADLRGWEWYYLLSLCHGDLFTLRGHESPVWQVAWSPNGEQLASASSDRTVKIWDARTGREIRSLAGHTGNVSSVVWSPDGRVLASGSGDGTVRLWDAATGRTVGTLQGYSGSTAGVAWSPDGSLLGMTSGDQVGVWDVATRQKARSLPVNKYYKSLAWNPDGHRLAIASGPDGAVTITIWDATTGKEIRTLRGQPMGFFSIAWSPDGRRLASGAQGAGPDRSFEARIWDASTGEEVLSLKGLDGSVVSVAWSPDGRQLATAGASTVVTISDAATGAKIRTFRGHTDGLWSLAWSPDGNRLASSSIDGTIRIWDAARDPDARILPSQHTIFAVAWSPDGQNLAASGGETVTVWDVVTGKVIRLLGGHAGGSYGLAWSPDGKRLASGDAQATVTIWEAGTGRRLLDLKGHSGVIWALAWKPDGHFLASGSGDKTVKIWDVGTGKNIQTLHGHTNAVAGLAWSPDGNRLVSAQENFPYEAARIWDPVTGQQLFCLENCSHGGAAWSPDGRWLAAPGGCVIGVSSATNGQIAFRLGGHTGYVFPVAWHPGGNRLASAAEDGTIKIWDTEARQEVVTLSGHTAPGPSALAWSPNGRCLAAPNGKDVKIWDASIGYKLAASPAYPSDVAMRQGRLDDALAIYERLAGDFPNRPEYRRALAKAFCARGGAAFDAGDHKRALPDFDQAIRLDPENASAYDHRAHIYLFEKGELDRAIADCDKALQFLPGAINIYNKRAEAYYRKGQHDKAIVDYCEEVLRNQPADGRAKNQLAWCLATHPDPQCRNASRAVELAKQAVALDPKAYGALNTLGVAQYRAGDYQGAMKTFDKAMELLPGGSVYDWFFMAMAHFQLGRKAEARKWYDTAVQWSQEHSPNDEELLRFRAEAAQLLGIPETPPPAKQDREKPNKRGPKP